MSSPDPFALPVAALGTLAAGPGCPGAALDDSLATAIGQPIGKINSF